MSTAKELATFAYTKGTDGCFLVPFKRDKWFFGRLQHNISWFVEDDCGTFLLDDGTVRTFSVKDVDAAFLGRLRNKIPVHLSEHKKAYRL
jgi:hypothetical protein